MKRKDIKSIGALGTAGFYKEMRALAQSKAGEDDVPTLKQRVSAACDIMLRDTGLGQDDQKKVKAAIVQKLDACKGALDSDATSADKAAHYTYKALMADDKHLVNEGGKRAIGAAAGLLTGAAVGGGAVGIGAATGSVASEAALEAIKQLFHHSAKEFGAELAAGNPILIGVMIGIVLGIGGIIAGAVTAVEAVESGTGRRAAAKNLESAVKAEYDKVVPNIRSTDL